MAHRIPFNKPYVSGKELEYVTRAITAGEIAADGRYTKGCARFLEERFGIAKVLMMPSCTAGLEMAALLCDLAPGDEVIMPSYRFEDDLIWGATGRMVSNLLEIWAGAT